MLRHMTPQPGGIFLLFQQNLIKIALAVGCGVVFLFVFGFVLIRIRGKNNTSLSFYAASSLKKL